MIGLLFAMLVGWLYPQPSVVAERSGATCEYGCLVGQDGWVYELSWHDVVSFSVALECEVGGFISYEEGPATAWSLVQNFYRYHTVGRHPSFSGFVRSYSACSSVEWSSLGTKYNPRITARADRSLTKSWSTISRRTRLFVEAFLLGMHRNLWPGYVFVLTSGWEEYAEPSWIGPYYTEPHPGRSKNAYYRDEATKDWTEFTVSVVPATTRERRFLDPGSTDSDWPEE